MSKIKRIIEIDEKIVETLKTDCLDFGEIHEVEVAIANGKPYEERPQGEWIPVSERLPDKKDYYYVWISDSDGEERPCSNWFDGERFVIEGIFDYTVLAWKKMYQEPYKKEGE